MKKKKKKKRSPKHYVPLPDRMKMVKDDKIYASLDAQFK